MTPHHGSWETSGLYAASKIKTFTMYKPLRNKILDEFVFEGRQTMGSSLVETDNSGVKRLLKALRENYGINDFTSYQCDPNSDELQAGKEFFEKSILGMKRHEK